MQAISVRPLTGNDSRWVGRRLREWWAGPDIVTRGRIHDAASLPGFIAVRDGERAGLVTYNISGDQCEIVTLNSLVEGAGIGTALINAVRDVAVREGCKRLWLVTTNDNTAALRFYQQKGFRLAALRRNALEQSRRLKPEIPLVGNDGIPLRDEIELEMILL